MDSFEFTKIAGAVLSALLLIVGGRTLIEARLPGPPAQPGYVLALPQAAPAAAPEAAAGADAAPAAGAASGAEAVLAALPKANAENGKGLFSKCKSCHTIEKGKPKGVGPNLWGVVNRPKASAEGFDYSASLKEKGGNWTFEDLAHFIIGPKAYASGTKMVFSGLPAGDAADVIAYLASQHEPPVELPK